MKLVGTTWLPDADTYFTEIFKETDTFDEAHLIAAMRHVRNFRCFADIGAHVGTWSRYCAQKFNYGAAFEPAKDVYECCQKNLAEFPNVVVYNRAVGDCEGSVRIVDDETRAGNTGSRYVLPGSDINMLRLDDFNFPELDFLKIDVEGFELQVLQGAVDTISTLKPTILMEVKKNLKLLEGKDPMAAVKFLESLGYTEVERIRNDRVYTFKERS